MFIISFFTTVFHYLVFHSTTSRMYDTSHIIYNMLRTAIRDTFFSFFIHFILTVIMTNNLLPLSYLHVTSETFPTNTVPSCSVASMLKFYLSPFCSNTLPSIQTHDCHVLQCNLTYVDTTFVLEFLPLLVL